MLEPWGVLAKTAEALFLVVYGFELTWFGRRALVGCLATVLVVALAGAALILIGGEPTHHKKVAPSQQHDSKKHAEIGVRKREDPHESR